MHEKDPRNLLNHRERGPRRNYYTIHDVVAVSGLSESSLYDRQKLGHLRIGDFASVVAFVVNRQRGAA